MPVQLNNNINKGIVYAAANTYWLHKKLTPKRFYSIYCKKDSILTF